MTTLPEFIALVVHPNLASHLPSTCWLARAHGRGSRYLPQIEGALAIVDRAGELDALVARARAQHPVHDPEKDARFMDVLSEAAGFAFGREVLGLSLSMSDDVGKADYVFTLDFGGETKSIHPPPDKPQEFFAVGSVVESPSEGLVRKVSSHLRKANKQLAGATGTGSGFVFINVLGFADLLGDLSQAEQMRALADLVTTEIGLLPAIATAGIAWNFDWENAVRVGIATIA